MCFSLKSHLDYSLLIATLVLIAAYSTGLIQLFSLPGMCLLVEKAAHIRWITQLLPISNGFVSAAEDSFIHLWQLDDDTDDTNDIKDIDYVDSLRLVDCLIIGAVTVRAEGGQYLISVYDRPLLYDVSVVKR